MAQLFGVEDLEAAVFDEQDQALSVLERMSAGDMDAFPALELTLDLEDGRSLVYETFGVFVHGEKEYVVLCPTGEEQGEIHLMELTAGENDEINLLPIPDEDWDAVAETCYAYFGDDLFGEEEFDEVEGE